MDRRTFLRRTAAAGAASFTGLAWLEARAAHAQPAPAPFEYGVASGDPLADRVIIWTRVSPADAGGAHGVGTPVSVRWEVATDEGFGTIVRSGTVETSAASDHTVKVDVTGLAAGTHHWYRFTALGATSPVARTTTAPASGAEVSSVRFGVASCANWEAGYFGAYRGMLEQAAQPGHDLDFVLHVGDYLYEYENGRYGPGTGDDPPRLHDPAVEMVTLDDYRRRHAQYKTDPDLRALHLLWPFITTWDDHELTDNAWWDGANNHQGGEGDWQARKRAATQAYFEWQPVRDQTPTGSDREVRRLFRRFAFGGLVDLFMLDLRQYRDEQVAPAYEEFLAIDLATLAEPGRTITGPEQLAWLIDGLATSAASWRMVGNPVMVTPLRFANAPALPAGLSDVFTEAFGIRPQSGVPLNTDDWSGYPHDQDALLAAIAGTTSGTPIDNVVFLTGDIHTSWACDVPVDQALYPAIPSVAAEFVCPSITSQNIDEIAVKRGYPQEGVDPAEPGVDATVMASNPQVKFIDTVNHGFCICDVTAERVHQDWYYIADRLDPATAWAFETSWEVRDQAGAVSESGEPVGARPGITTVIAPGAPAEPGAAAPSGSAAPPSVGSGGRQLPATGGEPALGGAAALVAAAAAATVVRRRLSPPLDDRGVDS